MDCRKEDVAARYIAEIDAILGFDSSKAVENTLDLQSQLHYAGHHATVSQRVVLKPAKAKVNDLFNGQIPDQAYTPTEILGEDFTNPVLEAYSDYQKMVLDELKIKKQSISNQRFNEVENKVDAETLAEFKSLSGLNDAVAEAKSDIDTFFGDDPDRASYASSWLEERIFGKGKDRSQTGGVAEKVGVNLNRNLLINNIRGGLQNWTQLTTTTIPEFGMRDTVKGFKEWKQAVKEKRPELETIGGERFLDESSKFDFFSSPEAMNQGVTYYAAKLKAIKAGKSETQAKIAGNKAVEQLQFKFRPGNEPRGTWRGGATSQLSLMSYAIQMRKLHHGWFSDAVSALKKGDTVKFKSAGKKIAAFYVANALVNGASSAIPSEAQLLIKTAMPGLWADLKELDDKSLLRGATAEMASIPLSPLGAGTKVPLIWDKVADTYEKGKRAFEHPDKLKSWISFVKDASLMAPPVPIIGNKNAGNLLEFVYRATFGDYDRYLPGTSKKYQSNIVEEALRIPFGAPAERQKEAANYKANKAK